LLFAPDAVEDNQTGGLEKEAMMRIQVVVAGWKYFGMIVVMVVVVVVVVVAASSVDIEIALYQDFGLDQ
jgi:hypothetical protein